MSVMAHIVELDNLCRRIEPASEYGGRLRGARRTVYRLNVENDSCVGVYNDHLVLQEHDGVSALVGGEGCKWGWHRLGIGFPPLA